MSVQDLPSDPETTPEPDERIMRRLVRALDYSKGFWLGFAKSNTPAQRRRLSALCKDLLEPLKIRVLEIELNEPVTDLLPVLRERLAQEANSEEATTAQPKLAIFVHGLERSIPSREAYPPLLSALNLKRELFRQEVPHPLLLWLPDYALTALARKAPDFWAWRSGLYEFAPERDAAEQSLKVVRGEGVYVTENFPEHIKREKLVMLKGLLDDYLELGNGPREQEARASILIRIGFTHQTLGEWTEAEQAYKGALAISHNLENRGAAAAILHNLARIAQERGEIAEARRLYGESLKINKALGNQLGVALTLHNLAILAKDQGEVEEARGLYGESLDTAKKIGDQRTVARILNELGTLAQGQGEVKEARRHYEESLKIKKKLGNRHGLAITLHQLATLEESEGKNEEARRLYEQSLEIANNLGDQHGVAGTLNNLGLLAESEGDKEEATRLFREALKIFERLGSRNAGITRRNLERAENKEDSSD